MANIILMILLASIVIYLAMRIVWIIFSGKIVGELEIKDEMYSFNVFIPIDDIPKKKYIVLKVKSDSQKLQGL